MCSELKVTVCKGREQEEAQCLGMESGQAHTHSESQLPGIGLGRQVMSEFCRDLETTLKIWVIVLRTVGKEHRRV